MAIRITRGVNSSFSFETPQLLAHNSVIVGTGHQTSAPAGGSLRAAGAGGTNIGGTQLKVTGGQSTGSAAGGDIFLEVSTAGPSGSASNSFVTGIQVDAVNKRIVNKMQTFIAVGAAPYFGGLNDYITFEKLSDTSGRWIMRNSSNVIVKSQIITFSP